MRKLRRFRNPLWTVQEGSFDGFPGKRAMVDGTDADVDGDLKDSMVAGKKRMSGEGMWEQSCRSAYDVVDVDYGA